LIKRPERGNRELKIVSGGSVQFYLAGTELVQERASTAFPHCARQRKAGEKQVAMIAQKAVDAKHA